MNLTLFLGPLGKNEPDPFSLFANCSSLTICFQNRGGPVPSNLLCPMNVGLAASERTYNRKHNPASDVHYHDGSDRGFDTPTRQAAINDNPTKCLCGMKKGPSGRVTNAIVGPLCWFGGPGTTTGDPL